MNPSVLYYLYTFTNIPSDKYLKTRQQASFDRNDFDSLSNIFVSKLVIRAH